MLPEIIRLLDLGPNASAGQIKRTYKKRRKEISPELTRELERLDAAYGEFTGRKAEVYSEEQLRAMHLLGFVPGCSLKEAEKIALDRGKDETEIRKASALLAPLQPKTGPGRIVSFVLRKILAFLPFLLVVPFYKLILDSGVNFFPGHSDPELAEWFSGTLLASATVSVLFTVTVPLLLSAILRRKGSKKRLFRKLGILPASPSLKQDLSAELDLLLVFTALVLTITGPQFYRNTVDYLADYRDMKNENYLSVQLFAPDHVPNGRRYSSLGSLISDGGGLVLDVRDALYDNSSIGSKNGDIHETVYHYLPRTKLVHHADVRSWRLTN
ncbi:MAG: hypothetical protein IKM31_08975 [Oscillospiraceae bacterium]|nr:hypothetical protein [Oscillospiraceae bacterium]